MTDLDEWGDDWAELTDWDEPAEHHGPAWRPGFDQPDGDRAVIGSFIRDVETVEPAGEFL